MIRNIVLLDGAVIDGAPGAPYDPANPPAEFKHFGEAPPEIKREIASARPEEFDRLPKRVPPADSARGDGPKMRGGGPNFLLARAPRGVISSPLVARGRQVPRRDCFGAPDGGALLSVEDR